MKTYLLDFKNARYCIYDILRSYPVYCYELKRDEEIFFHKESLGYGERSHPQGYFIYVNQKGLEKIRETHRTQKKEFPKFPEWATCKDYLDFKIGE